MIKPKPFGGAIAVFFAMLFFPAAHSAETQSARVNHVPGEKIDSGLGELPPYGEWARHPVLHVLVSNKAAHQVLGEKIDSGLGELPPYREWANHPALHALVPAEAAHNASGEEPDSAGRSVSVQFQLTR